MKNDVVDRRKIANKKLKERGVWWFAETYLDCSEFEFALSKASHWAYIYHDKDTFDDGSLKVPHWHVLLHYDNARSGVAVLKDFVGEQNTFVERCSSPVASYEYLIHANDLDKYQYSADRIMSHNPIYWEHFLPSIRDRTQVDFIEDLLTEEEPDLVYMARKYGRDFIKNYRSYMDFRDAVRYQDKFNDWNKQKNK